MTETRRPQFRRGIHVLVLFLIVGVVKSVLTAGTRGRLVGPDAPPAFGAAVTAGSYAVSPLIVVAVLRYEEVGIREVGAARRPLLPGAVAVAGL